MKKILFCGLVLLAACENAYLYKEEPTVPTPDEVPDSIPDEPDDPDNPDYPREALILTNDTARFFVSKREVGHVTLTSIPDPRTDFQRYLSPYRMPTKSEAQVLRKYNAPDGFWKSRQRILCYDETTLSEYDSSVIPAYYTFEFGGTSVTKAGSKTNYCVLGIRSEPLPRQDVGTTITVNDQWE